ncbi:hypothetical protein NC651_022772 [Populus alba x Populus x berolinensis]|nr:hypothetical protein NC651_022772 [Populus alba x Populus x berolinensis]
MLKLIYVFQWLILCFAYCLVAAV